MLRIAIITVWVLMITIDQGANGYTITGRSRDYTNSYSSTDGTTGGFIGLSKESHTDLADQLSSSSAYIPSNTERYASVRGNSHSGSSTSYPSASYSDSAQSNGYVSHSSNTPDALNSISSAYTSDAHPSSESNQPGYATGSSNADEYSSSNSHGAAGFAGYAGSQSSNSPGLSGGDHTSPVDYNSPSSSSYPVPSSSSSSSSSSSPSSLPGYVISGPKAAAYTAGHHGHANSPFATSHSYMMSSGHSSFPGSSHSNSFPSNHLNLHPGNRHGVASYPPGSSPSSHGGFPDGPRFSASSLSNYLSPHSSGGPSNFIHSGAPTPHRSGIPPFLLGASSNVNPTYSKGPGPFYPGPGPFTKGGNKYIIIKEGPGNHAAMLHPGEPSFPSRIFSGASGFKVKSSSPFASGPHLASSNFVSGLHSSSGYPGITSAHHSGPSSPYYAHQ